MTKITEEEIDTAIKVLLKFGDWFEHFGLYSRAGDCDRLLDGIELYRQEILGEDDGQE